MNHDYGCGCEICQEVRFEASQLHEALDISLIYDDVRQEILSGGFDESDL